MPYDPAQHLTARPNGSGGVRLRFKDAPLNFLPGGERRKATNFTEAAHAAMHSLARNGRTDENDEVARQFGGGKSTEVEQFLKGPRPPRNTDQGEGGGQVIASLGPPDAGMVYRLEQMPDGSFCVLLVEDDGGDLDTNDRTLKHALNSTSDRVLAGINRRNRARRSRDARTIDQRRATLFRHFPAKGERLALEGPDEYGGYNLMLVSDDHNVIGKSPRGAMGEAPEVVSSSPPRTTDRSYLARTNERNRRFWNR